MKDELPTKSPDVVLKELEEGGVLFCSRTETYFGMNEVGAMIWKNLPEPGSDGSLSAVVEKLRDEYPDAARSELEADLREFVEALRRSDLVTYRHVEKASS